MKSITTLKRAAWAAAVVSFVGASANAASAAVVTWDAGGGAASNAWYTNTNWGPDTAATAWTTSDVAQFQNAGTASVAGINFTTASLTGAGSLSIGAIEVTSARTTNNLTIGNSSGTVGVLTLNGVSILNASAVAVPNTILRNASGKLLTLQNNVSGSSTMSIALANTTDNVIQLDGAGNIAISNVISGVGKHITLQGAGGGRLLLSGQNTFSGGITVKTGATVSTDQTSSTGAITSGPLGTGALTIDGGTYIPSSSGTNTIANNITLNNVSTNAIAVGGTSTLSGNITGGGGFTKGSGGILILSGANNYPGQTIVNGGTLALAKTQSFYNGVPANWTDANFRVDSGFTLVYAVGGVGEFSLAQFLQQATVGTGSGGFKDGSNIGIDTTSGSQTISTVFTNNNALANRLGLVKSGTNTLFLTNANTHSGPTTVAGGTLNLSNLLAVQNSTLTTSTTGSVVFDQAAGGTAFTAGGLAGAGGLALQNNAGTPAAVQLTVGGNNTDANFTGSLSGPSGSSLTKVGTGIQTLAGSNSSFAGSVFLNAGTLAINSTTAFGSGSLTIAAGAKIDNTSGATKTLSASTPETWNGNFTWVGSKDLNLGAGPVTMAGNIEINATGTDAAGNTLTVAGAITGSGFSITKSGPGRVNLTGQSTFDGGVKVTGGTVHVGEQSSNLGSGTGPLGTGTLELSGGRLIGSSNTPTVNKIENAIVFTVPASSNLITANGTFTLSGIISGPGGLDKSGNGTVILANANTFSGDTVIDSGATSTLNLSHQLALQNSTLVASSTGGFIAFDGSVGSNAFTLGGLSGDRNLSLTNTSATPITLTIGNNNSDTTYTGILSGGGSSIIKVGTGTTTLGGANTYTGGATLANGTLALGSSGALFTTGTISFTGGTLQFSASNTTDYSARFSNTAGQAYKLDTNGQSVTLATPLTSSSGTLTKLGAGTLILSGAHSYSGGTTVSAGTLEGNTTSLQGNITNSAEVKFNLPSDGTYAGNMSGAAGVLTKTGAGKLTLTGTNNYGGGTTVSGGTLEGNTTSLQGAIANNAAVIFDQASTGTYSSNMTGSGNLTKAGAGKLILTGTNSYGGVTNVNAGTLLVNGSIAGSGVTVNGPTGVLGGTGTINAPVTVASGGTLSPGASIATLHEGATTFGSGSTFYWEFSGGPPPGTNPPLSADALYANGDLIISLLLDATISGANFGTGSIATGTKFVAITYSGTWNGGRFSNAPVDDLYVFVGGKQFRIDYNDTNFSGAVNYSGDMYGSTVTLTAVPEASSILVMGLGGVFAIGAVCLGKRRGWSLSRLQ